MEERRFKILCLLYLLASTFRACSSTVISSNSKRAPTAGPSSTMISSSTTNNGTTTISPSSTIPSSSTTDNGTPTTSPMCVDVRDDCRTFDKDVSCQGIYRQWAQVHCPAYCGFCTPNTTPKPCIDSVPNCAEYDAGNLCTDKSFRVWAEDHCYNYCGFGACTTVGWSLWTQWSSCGVTCGFGNSTRTRICERTGLPNSQIACPGNSAQTRPCNLDVCPIDGEWSSWGYWTMCSDTCGYGMTHRRRTCSNPAPSLNGQHCFGDPTEYNLCQFAKCVDEINVTPPPTNPPCVDDDQVDCPRVNMCADIHHAKTICRKFCGLCNLIDGNWSGWSVWSTCSVSCDSGTKSRTRSCTYPTPKHGGLDCPGNSKESKICLMPACPVDGRWAAWNSWQSCSTTCGTGLTRRNRICANPPPSKTGRNCFGDKTEYKLCTKAQCAVNGGWSSWTSWSSCIRITTSLCGQGMQEKRRYCNNPQQAGNGTDCVGEPIALQECHGCPSGSLIS